MSPAARAFHLRLERRAASLAPELRSALFRAYRQLQASISDSQLEAFIRTPVAERLLGEALTPEIIEQAFAPVSATLRDGVEKAATALTKDLPNAARKVQFNVLNPSVVEAIRKLNTQALSAFGEETRETIRAFIENGLRDGKSPTAIAREIRNLVGLAPNQWQAVDNFKAMLYRGDREALTRELRDARFDKAIAKAFAGEGLTDAQIEKMTEAYRKNFVAFHAETIAKTAALDAQRLGQRLSWLAAIDAGTVDGEYLFRRYSGVLDEKERDAHVLLEGEVVRWDEPYSSGQMYAGQGDYNCRCLDQFFVVTDPSTARRPGAGARGLTADQLRVAERLRPSA